MYNISVGVFRGGILLKSTGLSSAPTPTGQAKFSFPFSRRALPNTSLACGITVGFPGSTTRQSSSINGGPNVKWNPHIVEILTSDKFSMVSTISKVVELDFKLIVRFTKNGVFRPYTKNSTEISSGVSFKILKSHGKSAISACCPKSAP